MPIWAIDNLKVQCRSFFLNMQKSFLEYMTDRSLIEFIIKERVKCARKCRFKGERTETLEEAASLQEAIRTMTPPRNAWRRPRKLKRKLHKSREARDKASLRSTIRQGTDVLHCQGKGYGSRELPSGLRSMHESAG